MPPLAASSHAKQVEETLDPADWEEFRRFAHGVIDDTVGWLATLRERAAWQEMPEAVRGSFDEALPIKGAGAERLCGVFGAGAAVSEWESASAFLGMGAGDGNAAGDDRGHAGCGAESAHGGI